MRKSRKKKVIDATNDIGPPDNTKGLANRNKVKPRSKNQAEYIKKINDNHIIFCNGPAGSGKTSCAVGTALEYLFDDKVKKIVITRPVVEAGEKLGFLPGIFEEKLAPYLLPILDEFNTYSSSATYTTLKTNNKIEIVPLGFMRGRNFHNCFIIADECQNASYDQLKMLLTRIGRESKMVLTGDTAQSDLPYHIRGGFKHMLDSLYGIDGIGVATLDNSDIVRNPIIGKILDRLEMLEEKENERRQSDKDK